MSAALEKKFNDQITMEFEASQTYRQLAIELDVMNLPGMATWLRHQADEEIVHANKLIDHLLDRDNHPRIGTVKAPEAEGGDVLTLFTAALTHEQSVSASIRDLYRVAQAGDDLDSRPLLDWFLGEQIEEESTLQEIIGRVELVGDDGPGLLRLDEEMSRRPTRSTENAPGNG